MSWFTVTILLITAVGASAQTLTVDELLQSPRQFEGRRVSVSGYYESDWEGHSLFADRAAAKRADFSRAIWVAASPNVESPLRKAQVIGVFFHDARAIPGRLFGGGYGPWGGWPAALSNATIHFPRAATPASNQTIQRRAGSLSSSPFMKFHAQSAATRHLASRR